MTTAVEDRRNIDRRLSALETDMALVKKEQEHLAKMFDSRFDTVNRALETIAAKLDNLTQRLESQSSDPHQSIAGRALAAKIDEMQQGIESRQQDHDDWQALRRWGRWLVAGAGLTQIVLGGRVLGWW